MPDVFSLEEMEFSWDKSKAKADIQPSAREGAPWRLVKSCPDFPPSLLTLHLPALGRIGERRR